MSDILNLIISPPFAKLLIYPEIAFLAITLFFVVFITFALINTSWLNWYILRDLQEFFRRRPYGTKKVIKDWNKIKARLDTGLEAEYKLAILEADSTMDEVLKRMGFGGASLGERLDKLTAVSLPNLNEVRLAHQIRSNVVHDPDYKLTLDETKKTIAIFEKALVDLQAL
ncbi:MAG: hypothetical protein AAB959_00170 [Patescibacteria group bacterium]